MAAIVIFNIGGNPQNVTDYLPTAHTPDYVGRSDALINPDLSAVQGLSLIYWKHVTGTVQPMTSGEQAAVDAAIVAAAKASAKSSALVSIDGNPGYDKRAIAELIIDEINILREWIVSFKAQVALASSLADLKTRIATLPDLPDRTLAQAKTAYKNSINGVLLDE